MTTDSTTTDNILKRLPLPAKIEVGDMFGNSFYEELVLVLQTKDSDGERELMTHFGIQILERDILTGMDGGYVYLGRMPKVFLGKMREAIGIEDEGDDVLPAPLA